MLNEKDVQAAGFKPLRKQATEPVTLPSKPSLQRGVSFTEKKGAGGGAGGGEGLESPSKVNDRVLWDKSMAGTPFQKLEKKRTSFLERSNSFIGDASSISSSSTSLAAAGGEKSSASSASSPRSGGSVGGGFARADACVIVDPFSTGAHLAKKVCTMGYKCIRVFSIWDSPVAALIQEGIDVEYVATVQYNNTLEDAEAKEGEKSGIDIATDEVVAQLKALPFNIIAVIAGAETGVELSDRLSNRMNLRTNGESGSLARRNKYEMGEKVRAAGVRAVQQSTVTSLEQMEAVVKSMSQERKTSDCECVLKPSQSAGTDDVYLCSSIEECRVAFTRIFGKVNGVGILNNDVLLQEYLKGTEYVVDQVSRDGENKLCIIWEYDKRSVNNAHFVYFGMKIVNSSDPKVAILKAYSDRVLAALEIRNGPSHMEVKYDFELHQRMRLTASSAEELAKIDHVFGPCLVEVGSRCHGGEGTWLPVIKECVGFSQVDVTVDVYTNGPFFDSMDKLNYPVHKYGMDVDMVSMFSGVVRSYKGTDAIKKLDSFRSISWEIKIGDFQEKTHDCFTRPGCVQLVNVSESQLRKDFEFIHTLNAKSGQLLDFSIITNTAPKVGAIVVVDPLSSGANLAALVVKMGYNLIIVFSEADSDSENFSKLVTQSQNSYHKSTIIINHNSSSRDQILAEKNTLDHIIKSGHPILAILPGAETGVYLADKLSNRFGSRCNDLRSSNNRRNKYDMQNALKSRGVESIHQQLCHSKEDAVAFFNAIEPDVIQLPSTVSSIGAAVIGPKCVIKPVDSTGSDHVIKCLNANQVEQSFSFINNQLNELGHVNNGALVQEFLQGKEYVLDGVSRDSLYKVCAIWEYEKKAVNGADFVYHSMSLVDTTTYLNHLERVEAAARGVKEEPTPGVRVVPPPALSDTDLLVQALIAYAENVLDAVGMENGASHMELIVMDKSPYNLAHIEGRSDHAADANPYTGRIRLVEVGARCHGGNASWLPIIQPCIGYNQMEILIDAYVRPDQFEKIPKVPKLLKQGKEVFLISKKEGLVAGVNIDQIRQLKSCVRIDLNVQPGMQLVKTTNIFTRPGSIQLVNPSSQRVEEDYAFIRNFESGIEKYINERNIKVERFGGKGIFEFA